MVLPQLQNRHAYPQNYMKTLEEHWITYKTACYPNGIPSHQERECHQAFFSGALIALNDIVASCSELSEEQAYNTILKLIEEAEAKCIEYVARTHAEHN